MYRCIRIGQRTSKERRSAEIQDAPWEQYTCYDAAILHILFRQRHQWAAAAGIALLILLAYGRALFFDFAPIDDHHLIVDNPAVREFSFASIQWMFTHLDPELYIPLTYLSFFLEHAIAGLRPWVFHVDNLILHTANAWLLFVLARRMLRSTTIALCIALLFAMHPLLTETVVWIAARKDLLSTLFVLLTIVTTYRTIDTQKTVWFVTSVLFFLCALLSKISVAPLPVLLLCLYRMEGATWKMSFKKTFLLFLFSLLLGVVALAGKETVLGSTLMIDRFLLAGHCMTSALRKIFLPFDLSIFYGIPTPSVVMVIVPLLLTTSAAFFYKKLPVLSLGIVWFVLMILPALYNVQIDIRSAAATFNADRYAYLPFMGILLAMGDLAFFGATRMCTRTLIGSSALITTLLACILIPLSYRQTAVWESAETLYTHAVKAQPRSIEARVALAREWRETGKLQEAFDMLKEGLAYGDDARLHLAAGFVFAKAGQAAEAEEQFFIARRMAPTLPEPLYGLGGLAEHSGRINAAIGYYSEALVLEPDYAAARKALERLQNPR